MKKFILLIVFLVAILSACGNDGQTGQDQEVPEMIEVELMLPEEKVEPGNEVVLEAYVSQGGEAVEDADKVEFEVLRKGETDSEKVEGEHQGEGNYTAPFQFAEDGIYAITAHVTARDMHNMPTKELVIGTPSEATEVHEDDDSDEESHHEETAEHSHGHEGDVVFELMSGLDLQVNENNELSVLIKEKDQPLTNAKVSFEVWSEGQEKHEYIDATEAGDGVYKANKTFESAGNHLINVHVNKGDLHEHQLYSVTVQ